MKEITLKVGGVAPEFTLFNQNEKEISLASFKGKKVLLSFHPLAWTTICEIQIRTLEVKKAVFDELNTIPLSLSVDSIFSKKAWAKAIGVEQTDMLADFWPHGDVAKKYDLFIEKKGFCGRANILIDSEGKIEFIKIYEILEVPDIEEVIKFIQKE
ncbi:MAG: redoxin domain-containing protein [Desulfobacterales bacterium]|nr:redoxin domain-containing protein [Desulfobacterales bacterium]